MNPRLLNPLRERAGLRLPRPIPILPSFTDPPEYSVLAVLQQRAFSGSDHWHFRIASNISPAQHGRRSNLSVDVRGLNLSVDGRALNSSIDGRGVSGRGLKFGPEFRKWRFAMAVVAGDGRSSGASAEVRIREDLNGFGSCGEDGDLGQEFRISVPSANRQIRCAEGNLGQECRVSAPLENGQIQPSPTEVRAHENFNGCGGGGEDGNLGHEFGMSVSSAIGQIQPAEGNVGNELNMSAHPENGQIQPASADGRCDADGEVLSSRVEVIRPGGGSVQTVSTIWQQCAPATSDNFADTNSLVLPEERWNCDASEAESMEEKWAEGEESFAKRLRTEEMSTSSEVSDERDRRIAAAWDHWRKLGEPKMHVAPMVDQSELPFRMLCRKYGATAAYTPMLHSRLFAQDAKYRVKEFTTCPEDRPLFVQFCANNPDTLLEAARLVEQDCDYVDINLGCPQRIAKKGNYGAFLMDNLPLIKSLVSNLASNLTVPVSCKIRVFPKLEDTLAYARMLEEAGCSLLAVHGRTRDQKNGKLIRADWKAIQAVKKALRIPVLGNGNIRWLEDVHACIASTGVDGVMSAEALLENPALYAGYHMAHSVDRDSSEHASAPPHYAGEAQVEQPKVQKVDERIVMLEYLDLCEKYPVPMRMVRGHVHKILGNFWFRQNPDIREELNRQHKLTIEWLKDMVQRLMARSASNTSLPPSTREPQVEVPHTL